MTIDRLGPLLILLACACLVRAGPSDVFEVDGKPARRAWIVADADVRIDPLRAQSAMLRRLDGIAAVLDKAQAGALRRAARRTTGPVDGRRVWVVILERDGVRARAEILRAGAGWFARSLDDPGTVAALAPERVADILLRCEPPVPEAPPGVPLGRIFDHPPPYRQSPVLLTDRVMHDRFYNRRATHAEPLSGVTRVLDDERFWARLPRSYDPARPAGVVVWCSPTDDWRIPEQFHAELDRLNLIACGFDDAGNFRKTRDGATHGIVDRLQLMLDAVETARRAWATDPSRTYIAGFSGGGRVSGIMLAVFPDVFSGAVPIGGLDSYEPAFVGDGKYVPARYAKPRGERWRRLRARRLWALTGSDDFNKVEMLARVEHLAADGVQARIHVSDGLGHEMPDAGRVAEALRWVDEPWRRRSDQAAAEAERLWQALAAGSAPGAPADAETRAALVRITAAAPWSDAAWRAAAALEAPPKPVSRAP